jgi:hypothetical protein
MVRMSVNSAWAHREVESIQRHYTRSWLQIGGILKCERGKAPCLHVGRVAVRCAFKHRARSFDARSVDIVRPFAVAAVLVAQRLEMVLV